MVLQSKLNNTAYSTADPAEWLTGDKDNIDPVFAGRVAYAGKVTGTKIKINDNGGYRSYDEQVKMYELYKAGKLQATAAYPGTSWHGSSLALDTSTYPLRSMVNSELAKYGLCKPLSKEGWHIQPIETVNMGSKCNMTLAPIDLSPQIKAKFGIGNSSIAYIEQYKYALEFARKLLIGEKDFSDETIEYFSKYEYWDAFKAKTGI